MTSTYNRLLTTLVDLNDVETTRRPGHVRDVTPIAGIILDTSIQLMRHNQYDEDGRISGATWYAFLQQVEDRGDGPKAVQMVLGEKAVKTFVRQFEGLTSRRRPLARERARERARENPTGFAKRDDDEGEELFQPGDVEEPQGALDLCGEEIPSNGETFECMKQVGHAGPHRWS